jgi:hypothetical protein
MTSSLHKEKNTSSTVKNRQVHVSAKQPIDKQECPDVPLFSLMLELSY